MRKSNQEIKDTEIIKEILSGSEICRIAMVDDGQPYILPFNYGYKDHCIYIHCAPAGRKIDLLRKNNHICFEMEQTARIVEHEKACKWETMYRSVVGYGTIEIVTDFENKKRGLEIIMAHYGAPDTNDFEPRQVEAIVILKLTISKITGKQSGNWDKESIKPTM